MAYIRLVAPWLDLRWYLIEFDADKQLMFVLRVQSEASLHFIAFGSIAALRGPRKSRVERDKTFRPLALREVAASEGIVLPEPNDMSAAELLAAKVR